MEKITKKAFVEMLCNNKTAFVGSWFRKDDVWMEKLCQSIKRENVAAAEKRTVTQRRSNSVVFYNGSALYLDQDGEKEYFAENVNGCKVIWQKLTTWDDFDEKYEHNYVVYAY